MLAKTAYVALWFPEPSETFIFREVVQLERLGLPVQAFALYGPRRRDLSPEMQTFSPRVERLGSLHVRRGFDALLYWLRRDGRQTRHLLRSMPLLRWGNPERTLENLWAFHAGFHLARRFEALGIEHIHSPWAGGAATAALVASTLTGIPFSFAARAGDIYPPEGALHDKVARAAFVRVNTAANVAYLQQFAGDSPKAKDKIKLVYNALTLENRQDAPVSMQAPFRFMAMGRMVRTKGFDVLLDACRVLKDQGLPFRLELVGSGSWEGRLRRQAEQLGLAGLVEFPGFVSFDKVPATLSRADVFVTPSVVHPTGDRDGIPNVIMEAMAQRLPVVATAVAGIPEVVEDGRTGLLVPQRDPQALAKAMAAMAADRARALEMAERARELVLERFDGPTNCRLMATLFTRHSRGKTGA